MTVYLATIGDISAEAEDHGGGVVTYSREDGFQLMYTYGAEIDAPEFDPFEDKTCTLEVYVVELYKSRAEFLSCYDWVDWDAVARTYGMERAEILKGLHKPVARACAIEAAAGYYGWREFDDCPAEVDYWRVSLWYNKWRTRYNRLLRRKASKGEST
jgi:hypothetical protein